MDNQNSGWYVIIGAVLALITSFTVEVWKHYRTQKDLRNNFKTVLKLELKSLLSIVDKLTESYGNITFFDLLVVDQFDRNLVRIESSRKDTIYLKEELKKEEILTCLNDLLVLASDIRFIENYQFNYKNESIETSQDKENRLSYCIRQRQMYSLRTIDLKRRVQDIINYLDKK